MEELYQQSRDPRGQVREEALKALGASAEGRALPVILLRLNDWVPQVRSAAEAALAPFFTEAKAPALLSQLGLLKQVLTGRRVRQGLWDEVSALLTKPALAPLLRQAFMDGDKARRLALLALQGDLDPHIVYEATVRGDPTVQLAAARRMLASPLVFREALQELESSRVPAVRALVLQPKLLKASLADRLWLRALLVDRSWRLRAQARAVWTGLGLGPLQEVYVTAAASPFVTVRATAATALSEIRATEALGLLQTLLQDPAQAVRGAALTAIFNLDADLAEPLAEKRLTTAQGSELRAATAIARRLRQRRARTAKKGPA